MKLSFYSNHWVIQNMVKSLYLRYSPILFEGFQVALQMYAESDRSGCVWGEVSECVCGGGGGECVCVCVCVCVWG